MKTLAFFFMFGCSFVLTERSISQDSNLTQLKFFKIYVTTSDDKLFLALQDEMGIDPKLDSYLIYVDIRSDSPKVQYLYLGDMNHPSAMKYNWSQFSENIRLFLIRWDKPNKMEPDK